MSASELNQNKLFPVFLKLENLRVMLVGGGITGLEKLKAILKNSPETRVTVVADRINKEIREIAEKNTAIMLLNRKFIYNDLNKVDILILATNNNELNRRIREAARQRHILTNVADDPVLCDFYLGSVVQKGDLKIGISTNGKSPVMARRIREFFEAFFPDSLQELIENLNKIRGSLRGDFKQKVRLLNDITSSFIAKSH